MVLSNNAILEPLIKLLIKFKTSNFSDPQQKREEKSVVFLFPVVGDKKLLKRKRQPFKMFVGCCVVALVYKCTYYFT